MCTCVPSQQSQTLLLLLQVLSVIRFVPIPSIFPPSWVSTEESAEALADFPGNAVPLVLWGFRWLVVLG